MLRPTLVALGLAACSSPAGPPPAEPSGPASGGTPAQVESPAPPSTARTVYDLAPSTRSTRVVSETRVETLTIEGEEPVVTTTVVNLTLSAQVLQPRSGAFAIELRLDAIDMSGDVSPMVNTVLQHLVGRTYVRHMAPSGHANAETESDDRLLLTLLQTGALLAFPDTSLTAGETWEDCADSFIASDKTMDEHGACRFDGLDGEELRISIHVNVSGDLKPPEIAGHSSDDITVAAHEGEGTCTYRIALDAPLPASIHCSGSNRKSGTIKGRPFTYENTHDRTFGPP